MKLSHAVFTAFVLAGCGGTPDRYAVTATPLKQSVRISLSSVELRNLSLPAYAAADEIPSEDESGKLVSDGSTLWADAPERAVGLELSRHLMAITGARVAPSPWPFESLPQGSLDIRFETMLARSDGSFQVAGQYFLGRLEGGARTLWRVRPECANRTTSDASYNRECAWRGHCGACGRIGP